MGDASKYQLEKLREGSTIRMRVFGHSMTGKIDDGSMVEIRPLAEDEKIEPGDIVLCRVHGKEYLHMVRATRNGNEYLIANNRGHINGWVSRSGIHGKFVGVVKER